MRKIIILTASLFINAYTLLIANPLSKNTVSGKVTDQNNKPIHLVTVSLLNAKDSQLIKVEITDIKGEFKFPTSSPGEYLLSYSSAGFEKKYSAKFTLTEGGEIVLPTVKLVYLIKKLDEIIVTGKKPLIEVKADKTIFNIENSITAAGSNALEMLKKSPGVQVDNNDNISMNGKNGVKIYIDGKMLQLDSKNVAEYLKGINSNDMEAIEMISNPSAKYDAAGNAGIINIRLKKNKKFGTNGSASAGWVQGISPKIDGSVSLNYRDKKVNVFGNLGTNFGNYHNSLDLNRTQSDSIFNMSSSQISNNKYNNAKVGMDYFYNAKNTFGFMTNVSVGTHNWFSTSETPIYYQPTLTLVKNLNATNTVPSTNTNANINLNYRFADTTGKEITVDADYGLFRSKSNSYQPNTYFDTSGNILSNLIYRNNTPVDINIYSLKADVEHKLGKAKIGYGLKFSNVITQNSFQFYDVINDINVEQLSQSNSFKYYENINAAYINYQRQLNKKFDLQAGVRAEQTNSNGILTRADGILQSDDSVKRSYLNLFPSVALTYKLNKKNDFAFTYSRRIDRPTYQDLNPFENKLDELTYEKGNAFLKPQYTDNLELKHIFAGMLSTSFAYSHVTDYATQVLDTTNKNATFVQQQNLATEQILSWHISSPLPIKKWWNGYLEFWYNTMIFDGNLDGKNLHLTVPNYGVYSTQSFTLGKDYSVEMSGWYSSSSIWGATSLTKPHGSLDIGFQKLLMQKRATIRLGFTDILGTNSPSKWNSNFGGLVMTGYETYESRTVRLNFTYRFGSAQIKSAQQRQTGLQSESNRIKN